MSKPAETILAFAAQVKQQDDFAKAVAQSLDAYGRTFNQISYHVNEFSALCKKYGKKQLLAALPADVQGAFGESLAALKVLWESVSPNQFPELPDEPVEEQVNP